MAFDERRSHQRRYFSKDERYFIEYKVIGKILSKKEVALTLNLSAGGLLFKSLELIPLNSQLHLDLSLPHIKNPIHLQARVVRVEPTRRSNAYNIALQYTDISEADRLTIDKFCLKRHEEAEKPANPPAN